jgi:RsiW-degrading membrane proteinase PrsW (M82 family)
MTLWLFLSGIIAPALFWIGYLYYKDRAQPEPLISLGLTYIMGIASGWICYKAYSLLPIAGIPADPSLLVDGHRLLFLLYCILVVGLIEELFKILPFLLVVKYFKSFDEEVDGIIYAAVIALGFASFENLNYLLYLDGFQLFGRAIASPLTHTVFASIWGYKTGQAFLRGRSVLWPALISLMVAAVIHGLFDFFTLSSRLRIAAAFLVLLVWVTEIVFIEKLSKSNTKHRR